MNSTAHTTRQIKQSDTADTKTSSIVVGNPLTVGSGFTGLGFRHADFNGVMDPLIMVDHYRMTEPTFGAHPHAGLSAVSVLFEDSEGAFNNRDSLGNDFDIHAGDLYWLNAGKGAVHDEAPRVGASIHGLQLFVNLPSQNKKHPPSSLHVKREHMPIIESEGCRVRLVLGESNGLSGERSPVLPFTILDGRVEQGVQFEHDVQPEHGTWIYALSGNLELKVASVHMALEQGESIAVKASNQQQTLQIIGNSKSDNHFVVLSGEAANEHFVQRGPFAMNSEQEIDLVMQAYEAGLLGIV